MTTRKQITRRQFLQFGGTAALATALAACAPATLAPTIAPAATLVPATKAPTAAYKEAPMLADQVKAGKLPAR